MAARAYRMVHKLGCPIAWISGALNKYSFFKVRLDESACSGCGLCDSACYLSALEPTRYSLFEEGMERPDEAFACSKCLACVTACPKGSLKFSGAVPRSWSPWAAPPGTGGPAGGRDRRPR